MAFTLRCMYDAFPDLPATYDSVALYNNRRDVQFYVEEAKNAGAERVTTIAT